MRRAATMLTCVAVLVVTSGVAGAASSSTMSADQLVRKLVKAGVCDSRVAVNAVGTKVQCTDRSDPTIAVDIVVTAFPKRSAMLRDLDRERRARCDGKLPGTTLTIPPPPSVDYLVGPNWWTPPFGGARQQAIIRALGGKLTTYACE